MTREEAMMTNFRSLYEKKKKDPNVKNTSPSVDEAESQ